MSYNLPIRECPGFFPTREMSTFIRYKTPNPMKDQKETPTSEDLFSQYIGASEWGKDLKEPNTPDNPSDNGIWELYFFLK
jgi:hypothetical protein